MRGTFFLPKDFYNIGFPKREGEGIAEKGHPLLLLLRVFLLLYKPTQIYPDNTDHILCTLRKAE